MIQSWIEWHAWYGMLFSHFSLLLLLVVTLTDQTSNGNTRLQGCWSVLDLQACAALDSAEVGCVSQARRSSRTTRLTGNLASHINIRLLPKSSFPSILSPSSNSRR